MVQKHIYNQYVKNAFYHDYIILFNNSFNDLCQNSKIPFVKFNTEYRLLEMKIEITLTRSIQTFKQFELNWIVHLE